MAWLIFCAGAFLFAGQKVLAWRAQLDVCQSLMSDLGRTKARALSRPAITYRARIKKSEALQQDNAVSIADVGLTSGNKTVLCPMRLYGEWAVNDVLALEGVRFRPHSFYDNPLPTLQWPRTSESIGWAYAAHIKGPIQHDAWEGWISRLRIHIRHLITSTLKPSTAAFVRAMVLGEGRAISEDESQAFRATGLAHVIAVSGMHVVILLGTWMAAFTWTVLRLPWMGAWIAERWTIQRFTYLSGAVLAPFYAMLANHQPSAWRAAWMCALLWLCRASCLPISALEALWICALMFGLYRPTECLHIGFWLSWICTYALIKATRTAELSSFTFSEQAELRGRYLKRLARRAVNYLKENLSISSRMFLATLPIFAVTFRTVYPTSIAANTLIAPVFGTVLLVGSCVHVAMAAINATLAKLVSAAPLHYVTDLFLSITRQMAHATEAVDGLVWHSPQLTTLQWLAGTLTLFTFTRQYARKTKLIIVLLMALTAGVAECHLRVAEQPTGTLRVTFVDIGQGDSSVIDLPDGRIMVIDAGGTWQSNKDHHHSDGAEPARKTLVELLKARRRSTIDIFVLTHPHPDHYGGLPALLKEFRIKEIWDNGQAEAEDTEGSVSQLLTQARAQGVRIVQPQALCGQPRHFSSVTVEVLWPCVRSLGSEGIGYDVTLNENNNSLVLAIEGYGSRWLFTGDIEREAENELTVQGDLRSDLLKVGHHGSKTSSTPEFVHAVSPSMAIISAGRANRFGHPHTQTLNTLRAHHVRWLSTQNGGVVCNISADSKLHCVQ